MLLLMLFKNIIEFSVIKLTSSRPLLHDPECTEMCMEILITHNIIMKKNESYEKL